MIPADSFLLDGDTAIVARTRSEAYFHERANRPCDTCGGTTYLPMPPEAAGSFGVSARCPDCDGTGRHTFDIEVDTGDRDRLMHWPVTRTNRVHVIDVLPIVEAHVTHNDWPRHSFVSANGYHWRYYKTEHGDNWHNEGPITLPPDAAPGKWLVRLAVHS